MFTSLQLKNFRGFTSLALDGLQRVNLIVGRNNAGKTSLLEAIAILVAPDQLQQMPGALRPFTGEFVSRYLRWLIHDRPEPKDMVVKAVWDSKLYGVQLRFPNSQDGIQLNAPSTTISDFGGFGLRALLGGRQLRFRLIAVHNRSPQELVVSFSQAMKRKDGEERLQSLLQQVDSRIRKIRIEAGNDGTHLLVDLGLSEMLPIAQVGQGVYRLAAIFSELVGEKPDICIIDEIENGIHHSMLQQVWTGLAAAAENLDIQIFATTHSHECIEAAHTAFSKRETYEFSIIQLFRVEEGVQGRVLDRKHIEAAMAGEIDLR
jgi:AAA domain, putative AbiEii toxin, Type IV TA system/AAA ATPase domain